MKDIKIEKLRRAEAPLLYQAYLRALEEDFHYYPATAIERFKKIWSEKYFRSNGKVFIVAKEKGEVKGFLIGRQQWTGGGLGTIEWFWVSKESRGQGIARKLIKAAEDLYRKTGHHKICLEADNPESWKIYPKLGFVEEGFVKNHSWHHDEYRYGKVIA